MNKKKPTRRALHNRAFGGVIRQLRHFRGLTQEQLALDAGMDRTYISLLELGDSSPTLDTIVVLCRQLQVSLADLGARIDKSMATEAGPR